MASDAHDETDRDARPQSPASRGLRSGLLLALAATFLALAANDSWLLPALDGAGVEAFLSAASVAEGGAARLAVAAWDAPEAAEAAFSPPGPRAAALAGAMAALTRRGVRPHVAGLWILAAGLALLAVSLGWTAGGAAGFAGGLLAGSTILASALGVEAVTTLRPELPAAALVALQAGVMAYRPRAHLLHGVPAALAWAFHPAGAGAVAAAALWPWWTRRGLPGVRRPPEPRPRSAVPGTTAASVPTLVLLALGPAVAGLPVVPPVLDAGVAVAPLVETLRWAGAGLVGVGGVALGVAVAMGGAVLVAVDAASAHAVDADLPWDDPRAPDLVAARARAAALLLAVGGAVGAVAAGSPDLLEGSALLVAAPCALILGMGAVRVGRRLSGRGRWLLGAAVGLWLLLSGGMALATARDIRAGGRGFTAEEWVESELVRWLDNRLPRGLPLYASEPRLVLIQTALPARGLPPADAPLDGFAERFRQRPGALVLTGADTLRARRLADAVGATPAFRGPRGRILLPAVPPSP